MSKYGFIGTGNMGGALATALAKKVDAKEILLANRTFAKAEELAKSINANVSDNAFIAQNAKYIFLGVKPQMMADMLKEISPLLKQRTDEFVLITMAAGISTEKICHIVGAECAVVRIMPNTPALIGEGMILYTCNKNVVESLKNELIDDMSKSGVWDFIDEKLIDAASALSGCGPAFVYMFIEALADGAVKCGLPRAKALKYAEQTVKGSAMMLSATGKHPDLLKDEVCSPGGSTIAGVSALENGGFRFNCINAVESAYNKTLELGK